MYYGKVKKMSTITLSVFSKDIQNVGAICMLTETEVTVEAF